MTIRADKALTKLEFIRGAAKNSTKISDHMKDVIATSPKRRTLYYFGECETVADVEKKANEIETRGRALLAKIGMENII